MKIKTLIWTAAILLAMHSVGLASLTNVWPFTSSGEYELSSSNDMEIVGDTARLKLQGVLRHDASLATYMTNDASGVDVALGADVSLVLGKSGPQYARSGEYVSRVFDGGGQGNVWEVLDCKAFNTSLNNGSGELSPTLPGLSGLYHFNNDNWLDYVTGSRATAFNHSRFNTEAKLGSHSAEFYFNSGYAILPNASLLNGATQMTISCWVRLDQATANGGLVYSRGSKVVGLSQGTAAGDTRVRFTVNTLSAFSQTLLPLGTWVFVTTTWGGADQTLRIYINGELETASQQATGGTITQDDNFYVASDKLASARISAYSFFDEVAIWRRQLSDTEVRAMYEMASAVRFQLRADGTIPGLAASSFVGPDGTPSSYYSFANQQLISGGGFLNYGRYAQYKVSLAGQVDGAQTPYVDSVGLLGSQVEQFDNTLGDFRRGTFVTNAATAPAQVDLPYLRLARNANGGYLREGTFTSRVLDGGGAVLWDRMYWTRAAEVAADELGLLGLWRLDGGWADSTGRGYNGAPFNMAYTSWAKLGVQSAVFNGVDAYASLGSLGNNAIRTVEFWVNDGGIDDGLMQFSTNQYIAISNGLVTAVGFTNTPPTVFVNGSPNSRRLDSGWNHVAVVYDQGVVTTNLLVGVANGDYMLGMMDELAIYSRSRLQTEVKTHLVAGGRASAGSVKFQVRADSVNPPDSVFVGPGNSTGTFFTAGAGIDLPSGVWNQRYFQYRAYLEGDGDSTPLVKAVRVTHTGATSGSFTNDDATQFGLGVFDGRTTEWGGDEIQLIDLTMVPGLININPVLTAGLEGLWHMDDTAWGAGATVLDSSPSSRHGFPQGNPILSPSSKVGSRCGLFSGSNQYVILPSFALNGDFTVSVWFRTTSTNRTALLSRPDGRLVLEVNGDGSGAARGQLALVVSDGGGARVVASAVQRVNDGVWHNVTGVRQGSDLFLYVDGIGAGSRHDASLGVLGAAETHLARHGVVNTYYAGYLDEVVIFNRAITESEMAHFQAVGRSTEDTGTYRSPVLDAGRPAIWESVSWRENGTFGEALGTSDPDLLALWHLDETNGTEAVDAVGGINNGDILGAFTRPAGVFGASLGFDGSGGHVQIPAGSSLEPPSLTVEAWVYPSSVDQRTIFDHRDGSLGYRLATDANGKPYFWVSGASCLARGGLRPGQWHHVAGTYDGSQMRLFVDGRFAASAWPGSLGLVAGPASIGRSYDSSGGFNGMIDEVAVHARALGAEEILDHARAGTGQLVVQVRASDDPLFAGSIFVGPDGTSNSYYRLPYGETYLGTMLGRYFQYQLVMTARNGHLAPAFHGLSVNQSSYPINNPWVMPANGYGRGFLGNLLSFAHVLATNDDTAVRYQISGNDGTNWYHWSGTEWENVTGFGWDLADSVSEIDGHIGSFYEQLHAKTGGVFRFRAYLHSGGTDQVAIDEVRMSYAPGRLVMLEPNGTERGASAWLKGVPYTVHWTHSGTIGSRVRLDYSLDSGGTWTTIATNVPSASGSYSFWTTPVGQPGQEYFNVRVRVTDMADETIGDMSDADFSLVERFRMVAPNGGEIWYIGRTNVVRWASSVNLGRLNIDYAYDGTNYPPTSGYRVAINIDNIPGGTNNAFNWDTPRGIPALLSERGKMRVQTVGSQGSDQSDGFFTLAGIEITNPQAGSAVKRNGNFNVRWTSAGAGSVVALYFSSDAGTTWNFVTNAPNQTGTNALNWFVTAPPTDLARLKLVSLSDPNAYGISAVFTLADIDILSPTAGTVWPAGSTNRIVWLAGGAGNLVNIYYSTNSGGAWTTIIADYANVSGSNSYMWTVPPYPGPMTKVKIESVADPENLFATTPDFSIAGVRILAPNGGEKWVKDADSAILWTYQSAGQQCSVYFSYGESTNYQLIGGPGIGLSDRGFGYQPTRPTVQAKAKMVADNPAPFTNMFDESDAYFTVAGIMLTYPTNQTVFTIGTTNLINWTSAGSEDPLNQARIVYTTTGVDTNLIAVVGNNQAYPGGNSYTWFVRPGTEPSDRARIVVASGGYAGSTLEFLIRGIKIVAPAAGSVLDIGDTYDVTWRSAGLDASANGNLYVSTDGGRSYSTNPLNPGGTWPVQAGGFPWTVDVALNPTTNALVKFVVTESVRSEDIGVEAVSPSFALRGMKVVAPALGDSWAHRSTNSIRWISALVGGVGNITYSADGVRYDTAKPIAQNWTLVDGSNEYPWVIEPFRTPSTNARIKVSSTLATGVSDPFVLTGIRVTAPIPSDIWASDETNRIAWTSVGATPPYQIDVLISATSTLPIVNGWNATTYDWVVPLSSISTSAVIRVRDASGLIGLSDPFRIVGEPTIQCISPVVDEQWKVSQSYTITWSKGGKMDNNFRVAYSTYPFIVTNDIVFGAASYDSTNNTFSVPWSVPDRLGQTRFFIENIAKPEIHTVSDPFYVVGMFTVLYPNGGDTNLYALKPATVSWFTRGTVPFVNLYYSSDPLHQTGSWSRINTTPVANNGGGVQDELTTYLWPVANIESATVRFRVEQADRPGANDDSDANFSIRYFEILWRVYSLTTTNELDKLSVSDSSGWSQAGLVSPIARKYPYGFYDTVWSREFFYDKVIFNWPAEPSRTIDVPMVESQVSPDYKVLANFLYDLSNGVFRSTAWLERGGKVLSNPVQCTISIYDSTGSRIAELISTTPDPNGIFWQTLPGTLAQGVVYFARVDILYSRVSYSSGVTFSLRVPTDAEQQQMILNAVNQAASNILGSVAGVDTNVTNLASAQAAFRAATSAKLDSISNATATIQGDIARLITNIAGLDTSFIAKVEFLTNTVGVIAESVSTSMSARLDAVSRDVLRGTARILTRPTAAKTGARISILYRSRSGLLASIGVTDPAASTVLGPAAMTEIGLTGIYEYNVTFDTAWGLGDFTVACSDGTASDRLVIRVTAGDIDDVFSSLVSVSNQIQSIETSVATMFASVTNVEAQQGMIVLDISNMVQSVDSMAQTIGLFNLEPLTNLDRLSSILSNVNWSALSNVTILAKDMTNILAGVSNIQATIKWGDVRDIARGVTNLNRAITWSQITNIQVTVSNILNDVRGLHLESLTNLQGLASAVSNLNLSGLSNISYLADGIARIEGGLSNVNSSVGAINPSLLTNLTDVVSAVSNLNITGLSNIAVLATSLATIQGGVSDLRAAINWTDITNIFDTVSAVQTAVTAYDLSGLAQVATDMTNVMTGVGGLRAALRWSDITNIMVNVSNTLATVKGLNLTNVSEIVQAISNINVGALTGLTAFGQGLTDIKTGVSGLQGQLGGINWALLTNTAVGVAGLQAQPAWSNISAILRTVTNTQAKLNALDLSPLTNIVALTAVLTNVDWTALGNVGSVASGITNLMSAVSNLESTVGTMDFSALTNAVDQTLNSLADSSVVISNLNASINTNLPALMATITNLYGRVGDVSSLANSPTLFGRLASISNSLVNMGSDTAEAIRKARSASTSAQGAQAGLSSLKSEIGRGKIDSVLSTLREVKEQLAFAQREVQEVKPKGVGVGQAEAELGKLLKVLQQVAKSEGLSEGVVPKDLVRTKGADADSVKTLNANIAEMKASVDLIGRLMDKTVNKPVFVESYEPGQ